MVILQRNDLLICGWMVFPVSVGARTVMSSTLIALMPSITFGLFHATSITGAWDALMLSSGGRGGQSRHTSQLRL